MSSNLEAAPRPPPPPRLSRLSHRAVPQILIMVAVVFVAIALVPLAAPWALVAHYECGPGVQVASELLWTPLVLVDSPYGGYANGSGTGGFGTGGSNGSSAGSFEEMRWNVSTSARVLVSGPGSNEVCTGYLARMGERSGGYLVTSLGPRNATSDLGQNTTVAGRDSVIFHNGYMEADRTLSTCTGGPLFMSVKARSMAIQVPFPILGGTATASATLDGAYNYTYTFPGHFGTWKIDDLNTGSDAPGGGLAFEFAPCV